MNHTFTQPRLLRCENFKKRRRGCYSTSTTCSLVWREVAEAWELLGKWKEGGRCNGCGEGRNWEMMSVSKASVAWGSVYVCGKGKLKQYSYKGIFKNCPWVVGNGRVSLRAKIETSLSHYDLNITFIIKIIYWVPRHKIITNCTRIIKKSFSQFTQNFSFVSN